MKLHSRVKWGDTESDTFPIRSGVLQGGVLSPLLFNLYVNSVLNALEKSKLGCCMYSQYIGCIMYADDLLLISASVIDLQSMLNICQKEFNKLGMVFNPNKSKCLWVGPNTNIVPVEMTINSVKLEWVSKIKYLGHYFLAGKSLTIDLTENKKKFFATANKILYKAKFCNDIVKLQLLESYCLPLLTYSLEAISLKKEQLSQINSWWNSIYRIIFNYNKRESVRELMWRLNRLNLANIYILRKILFIKKILEDIDGNTTLQEYMLKYVVSPKCQNLCRINGISLIWNENKIKYKIFENFQKDLIARGTIL